jgi:hypothetical protein
MDAILSFMRHAITILALGLTAAVSAVADIDLTPRFMVIGGGLVNRAYFADGNKQYAVTLDSETKLSADEGGALFKFTNITQATMRLRRSPIAKPPAFDAESLPEYTKAAAALLPGAAEEVTLESQADNVLPINRWKSCRFVYTYRLGGVAFEESITFLNLDSGDQIVVQTGSQRKDFPAVAERADDIIRRWHQVQPGDEVGLN